MARVDEVKLEEFSIPELEELKNYPCHIEAEENAGGAEDADQDPGVPLTSAMPSWKTPAWRAPLSVQL